MHTPLVECVQLCDATLDTCAGVAQSLACFERLNCTEAVSQACETLACNFCNIFQTQRTTSADMHYHLILRFGYPVDTVIKVLLLCTFGVMCLAFGVCKYYHVRTPRQAVELENL